MNKNNKNANTVVTLLIVLIIGTIIYFLIPKDFWNSVGSKNFKSPPNVGSSVNTEGGPTPTSLQFRNPFKYDKYEPTKKEEFLKKRQENGKNVEGKPLYWK